MQGLAGLVLAASLFVVIPANASGATPTSVLNSLGRGLALALADQSERAWLYATMEASPFVEHRVRLKELLLTDGNTVPLRQIRAEAGLSSKEASAITALPDLELYLAMETQRRTWRGDAVVDVAVRQTDGSYVVYSREGSSRAVPWDYEPGTRVTLTLAQSEIDYADAASALREGARTGDGPQRVWAYSDHAVVPDLPCSPEDCPTPPPPPPPPPSGGITTSHTQLATLSLLHDHEGALGGLNEIEIFGNVNGFYKDCGRVTGIHYGIDFNYYYGEAYPNTTLARAIPDPTHTFRLTAYEDDSQACAITSSDDYLGSWPTGIYLSQYGLPFYTQSPSELYLSVRATAPFE
jgi:hypothetical protein